MIILPFHLCCRQTFQILLAVQSSVSKAGERGEALFGEVIYIIPQSERECALMFLRVLRVKYFDFEHLFPSISSEQDFDMSKLPGDLIDYRPLNIVSFCDQQYVTPRYNILF